MGILWGQELENYFTKPNPKHFEISGIFSLISMDFG